MTPKPVMGADLTAIQAALFDLDGLLIDTVAFWREAERQAFAEVGLRITAAMSRLSASMTVAEATAHWHACHPWQGRSLQEQGQAVVARVAAMIRRFGTPLPGAVESVAASRARGWKTALVSNAPQQVCEQAVLTLGLGGMLDVVVSAEFVARGKPAPDVYLEAARRLGRAPHRCLAFEDSRPGVIAAATAGMRVVAVPSANETLTVAAQGPHAVHACLADFWRQASPVDASAATTSPMSR